MAHQSKYPSLDRQWHKMMFSFFEYLPMQYRQATEREWQIRKMIWSFKDGKAYLNIAWMIANKLHQVFGDDVKNIVFACVPTTRSNRMVRRNVVNNTMMSLFGAVRTRWVNVRHWHIL